MREIFALIKKLIVDEQIIDLVNDIRKNTTSYKIVNDNPIRVYRNEQFLLWVFDEGSIKLLGVRYTGYKARLVHSALCYAVLNGCVVE